MNGFGKYTFANGNMYTGFYKDDLKHGYGVYQWKDGKSYSGWWFQGK